MELIHLKFKQLKKALATLDRILKKLDYARVHTDEYDNDDLIAYRDSVIQRFEFSYELTWNFLKKYLKDYYALDVSSPKKIFQECYKLGILTEEETRIFMKMSDDRNMTSHTYNEEAAEEISIHIKTYYRFMIAVCTKLQIDSLEN